MNKKRLMKELERIQNVEQNLNVRIDELEKVNDELLESNNELIESNNELVKEIDEQSKEIDEQSKKIDEESKKIDEQSKKIDEQSKKIDEQSKKIDEQNEKTKDIKRVQVQQGIDIAALAKIINSLQDKKMVFEDEYAIWEDKYNRISEFVKDNPDLASDINLGPVKQGMDNAITSMKFIDEKLDKMYKIVEELQNFDKFNYNNIQGDNKYVK